ncbi:MAG: hypothetical protein B7X51_16355, partial [Pseudomonas sp. 34-62-33]
MGSGHQNSGRQDAIGGGTVAVQIDNHGGAFVDIDVCYYASHLRQGCYRIAQMLPALASTPYKD